MPAIQTMMKRLGFVRLRDYGLVLTPEGRILSIRPAVLDDGLGGRIVGWKEDDLAAAELDRWSELGRAMAQKPAALPAVATPVAVRPIAPLPQKPPPTPQKVKAVAPEPVVEEDDWEWTIAIARARAAAEEAEQAAATAQRPSQRRMRADTVPPPTGTRPKQPTPARPLPAAAMAMAKSAAEAASKAADVASKPLAPTAFVKRIDRDTTPLSDFDISDNTSTSVRVNVKDTVPSIATKPAFVKADTIVESPTPSIAQNVAQNVTKTTPIAKVAAPIAKPAPVPPPLQVPTPAQPLPVVKIPTATAPNRTFARGKSPATVIPIPKMPRVEPSKIAPVVARRPTGSVPVVVPPVVPIPPAQPRRFAKGTGPVLPSSATAQPNLSVGDETLPSLLLPSVPRSSVSR